MKEVKLPSGAKLKIGTVPFASAKGLYQAVLKELRGLEFKDMDQATLYKEIFCAGFTSPEIEKHLWECFGRCVYNDGSKELKIDQDTFEPVERRQDYMATCIEVAKEVVAPFVNSLYVEYQRFMEMIADTQK